MIVYLALGSNLGNKKENLQKAMALIAERIGILSAISSVYETQPWRFESENIFLNQVIAVETALNPIEVLIETQAFEEKIGRTSKTKQTYQDRIIDIDLILYGDCVFKSEALEVPHPLFHQRTFVLEPLHEIAPDIIHPVLKKTVSELLEELKVLVWRTERIC